ncbi:MAG: glycoside hydrolase family 13 protein [Bacillus sp. (in: firmicutes)]
MECKIACRYPQGNFRNPSGAIPDGAIVDFEIELPRIYGHNSVSLVWINDENGQYDYIKMDWKGIVGGRDIYEVSKKVEKPGIYWYYFQLQRLDKVMFVGKGEDGPIMMDPEPPSWQVTVYDQHFTTPDWIKGGIYYHIFVDRFARDGETLPKKNAVLRDDWGGIPVFSPNENGEICNNDFFGGNLKGIIKKLDYIQSLGVTCLYLSPVFEAASNHKYDVGDYSRIDQMFGDVADFRLLTKEARKRGIRVILDGVFNHTGSDSLYFNKKGTYNSIGAYQSKESEYYPWFRFTEYPDKYDCWWGINTLPAVNEETPSFMEFINGQEGIAGKWLKEGASGWRLDVVDELPDKFLEAFRNSVKTVDKEALIIGEVWEDASHKEAYGKRRHYFQGRQLDSVMNYPFMNAIINFVRYKDAANLHRVVTSIMQNYPMCVIHCLMNMIGTHDTKRALTALAGKELGNAPKGQLAGVQMTFNERKEGILLMKMASLLQMTLPGVPCIFYGDEAGMEGYGDPFNRRCYPWGEQDRELLDWYRKLGAIRKQHDVFKEGQYATIHADGSVYLFQRFNEDEKIIIGINRSDEAFLIDLSQPYIDLLQEEIIQNTFTIEPNGYCLLVQANVDPLLL